MKGYSFHKILLFREGISEENERCDDKEGNGKYFWIFVSRAWDKPIANPHAMYCPDIG